jgi:hypothetical protein
MVSTLEGASRRSPNWDRCAFGPNEKDPEIAGRVLSGISSSAEPSMDMKHASPLDWSVG